MATTVPNNAFDTQQPAATGGGIIGGTIKSSGAPAANNAAAPQQYNPLSSYNAQTYTAQERNVDKATETAAGQVESLLAKDNPLMQRARTLATQNMAQRGLVNSSMSQGAGVAAMVDRITPIAQQDAATYSNRSLANQSAVNEANQFNVGQNNNLFSQGVNIAANYGLQKEQQNFSKSEREAAQTYNTGERTSTQGFQAAERTATQNFQSAQATLDRAQQVALADKSTKAQMDLQTAQQNFTKSQTELERVQQLKLQDDQQAFLTSNAAADRAQQDKVLATQQTFQANQALLDRTQQTNLASMQIKASQAQIPANFAASISNTAMTGVNAIMADGNLTADQKKAAINNVVNYANSQIAWGEKFYGTTVPKITVPA